MKLEVIVMEFKIYAGLNGGFGGADYCYTAEFDNIDQAEQAAYEEAIQEYESYEGLHGILSYEELKEELEKEFLEELSEEEATEYYLEERDGWLDYYVKEVSNEDDEEEEYIKSLNGWIDC